MSSRNTKIGPVGTASSKNSLKNQAKGATLNNTKSDHGKKSKPSIAKKDEVLVATSEGASTNNASLAKSVIETSLFKSADVLSEFTEKTIMQATTEKVQSMGHRFGMKATQSKKIPSVAMANDSKANTRRNPDISKFPSNIANLLKEDSNCSVSSRNQKYHTKKMALRQVGVSSHGGISSALNTCAKVSKIVVLSTPLQLGSQPTPKSSKLKLDNGNTKGLHQSNLRQGKKGRTHDSPVPFKNVIGKLGSAGDKSEKKIAGAYIASVKNSQKVQIGVKNGIPFILGTKAKRQHFNSFGNVTDLGNHLNPSNRKWSINIGNFQDNEISFSLAENNLKITGFRQPTLRYPEGQTTAEEITIPPNFDINNLRVYRAVDANEVLILEEIQNN